MESSVIEKLNATNYSTWRDDVKVVLMDRGAWQIVINKEQPPLPSTPIKTGEKWSEVDPVLDKAYQKQVKDYNLRRDRAYSTLYLSIEKELRPLISETDDPVKAYEILQIHFRPDSRARTIGLTDDFFSCRIDPNEEIGLYAARLKKIATQLNDTGKPIDDWYQAFQLIRYLPPEYVGIVQSIYRWSDDQFKSDKVLRELQAEEARLKQCNKDQEVVAYRTGKEQRTPQASNKPKPKKRNPQKKRRNPPPSSKRQETSLIIEANASGCARTETNQWLFDTAATSHFCCNKDLMKNFKPLQDTNVAVAIGGVTCPVEGTGEVSLQFITNGECEDIILLNVLYSPQLRQNLISGSVIDKAGHSYTCNNNVLTVYHKTGRKLFYARRHEGLYYVKPRYPKSITSKLSKVPKVNVNLSNSVSVVKDVNIWHRRFCHINSKDVCNTSQNNSVRGLPPLKQETVNCDPCKIAKSRTKSFKSIGQIRSTRPLELVHMDLCGPMQTTAIGGHRYFLTITDDFSRKVTVYPVKEKSDVFSCFNGYLKRVERFLNSKIVSVRTDNGLEFCNSQFETLFEENGIRSERTNTYSPQQNGVSERYNYTATDGIKTLLKDSGLGNQFWAEALFCFTYVWNRTCHGNQKVTPFQLFGGKQPSVKHLKPFGTTAFLGIPKQLRRKLDMRAKKGVMVGYAQRTRGYRIWLPSEKKIVESINVNFEEGNINGSGAVLDPPKSPQNLPLTLMSDQTTSDSDSDLDDPNNDQGTDSITIDQLKSDWEPKPGTSKNSESPPVTTGISFVRSAVPRKTGSRIDVYYRIPGQKARLRSHDDVRKYCIANNIPYEPNKFNFQGKNTDFGEVNIEEVNATNI